MTVKVHIIDSSKASLVMTSEVFKDKIPGSIVSFSLNAKEGLAHLQARMDIGALNAIVVDFDLPDADGVSLIKELRKFYSGPVFMTAHPDKIVDHAVSEELFHYHDACCWVPKPVRFDVLEKRIEQFVINRHRLLRRFDVSYPSLMVGKGEGRGKRSPKHDGHLINISLGGVCMSLNDGAKFRRDEEYVLTLAVPSGAIHGATSVSVLKPLIQAAKSGKSGQVKNKQKEKALSAKAGASRGGKLLAKQKPGSAGKAKNAATSSQMDEGSPVLNPFSNLDLKNLQEYKIKATVAWSSDGGRKVGLKFAKMPDTQRRHIEAFLKGLSL